MLINFRVLIIEPNSSLDSPYNKLCSSWDIQRIKSIELAPNSLLSRCPHVIFISNSYKITKCMSLLETIKNFSFSYLIPIIFVVDLTNHISYFPVTKWGGKIGIIHSLSSKDEIYSTLDRIFSV